MDRVVEEAAAEGDGDKAEGEEAEGEAETVDVEEGEDGSVAADCSNSALESDSTVSTDEDLWWSDADSDDEDTLILKSIRRARAHVVAMEKELSRTVHVLKKRRLAAREASAFEAIVINGMFHEFAHL